MRFPWPVYLIVITVIVSCKKPYLPPVIDSPGTYLVVEGVINSAPGTTIIKLSRTVKLLSSTTANPVSGAVLTVESDQAASYPLLETTVGTYSANLNLDATKKYRLRIKTGNNSQYVSDFVSVLNSPPIDSVSYKITANGLNIYSNTHDPKNNTRYYRWSYDETWIIHSNYSSSFKSNGDTVLARDMVNDQIYTCWSSSVSDAIILNSSAKLTSDVIADNPITSIPSTSEKIGTKYSILVTQYALSKEAYDFWINLKKNTEQLGSIFDAQPTQINGNIHAVTNPTEAVIGFISAGTTSSMRIFIENAQLPNWRATKAYPDCTLDTAFYVYFPPGSKTPVNQVNQFINYNKGAVNPLIPVAAISLPGAPQPIGYSASQRECVDCTLRGTNRQPAFWK